MDSKKIKVWAHRGASGYAPENTMDAFRKAIEMKADGIELDVNLTKDGEVVVIHDEVLDRVSDGTGRVQDFTCNELKKFNFNKIHPEYEKEEIPTLEEVYQLIKPTDLTINVEFFWKFYLSFQILAIPCKMGFSGFHTLPYLWTFF